MTNIEMGVEPLAVRPKTAWAMLSISHAYGYRLLTRNEFETYTAGSSRFITVASIKAFMARRLAEYGKVRESPRRRGRPRKNLEERRGA